MAKKTTEKKYEQDASEVNNMLDFYKGEFSEVHSVTCLNCNRVVAVEVAPMRSDGIKLEKGRTLYTVDDLLLSVRRRLDVNADRKPMYGYECVCGNSTIMAKVERGEVAERTVITGPQGVVSDTGPVAAASSPYELARARATISLKQASAKKQADYETDGTVERYETFKLERVK